MNEDKITEIFVQIDDFIQLFEAEIKQLRLESTSGKSRNRKSRLSDSEMMTILICFHLSRINDFKSFYSMYLSKHYKHLFPDLVSYERFVQSSKRIMIPLMVFLKTNALGACRGISFIDSTTVKVCHIKREKQHQVMKGLATKGKSTMGWFFGFKLHLIINDKGEILSFYLTKAHVDDRDMKVIASLTENIFGKLFGDRGYISQKLANYLWNDGIDLVYKLRKNMKKQNISDIDKIFLRKRALIESVNDELKNICSIEHSRHRSPVGFIINLVSGLCAYHFLPKKPSLNIQPNKNNNGQLLLAA
ncbi:IS982 family transposase [Sinomicrobium pectinilyticum]|uniref:IS982 family transposase n=1 Tax=Sinomicrobium pectinilyticum TaxID=1084421 RepID=A0A3N0CUS1_SINP1|nr:IS982 family transposase [Sinomicrobium pectinilyticum]RNL67031.1 IS982 family transposase [Sinomicrobium pectinilyticum]